MCLKFLCLCRLKNRPFSGCHARRPVFFLTAGASAARDYCVILWYDLKTVTRFELMNHFSFYSPTEFVFGRGTEQQAGALMALQQVDAAPRQAVLDEWAARCGGSTVRNPAGYLFGIIQKAIRGEFKAWAGNDAAAPPAPRAAGPAPSSSPSASRPADPEVARAYAGEPTHPVMRALMPCAADYGIEARHLLDIIAGCQMDLTQTRYLDFAALENYCHLVAGVVGEVSARIFGQTQEKTTEYAHKLGLAFQLTNIIRDVGEDAMLGRIYLPVSELQQFDVKAHEILKRQYSERFTALMRFQAERAHRLYDEAFALLPDADRRAQKPGLMMASIYRTLLREIEHENFQVLHQRIRLTPLRKFWLAWKVQALGRM